MKIQQNVLVFALG